MPYSLPYILFVIFFLCFAFIQLGIPFEEKSRKFLNFILIISYVLFFGFRGFIATDWINYYDYFKNISTELNLALKYNFFEPGFITYSVLIKKISTSYESFQLINTITNIILLHIFIKRYLPTKYHALAYVVFIVFNGFILEINLLRNFKAILILLLALQHIENREPIKYFLYVLLAISFHWTGILFIPLYFFLHKKIDIRIYVLIFVFGTVIYFLQIEYIKPTILNISKLLPENIAIRIQYYLEQKTYAGSNGLTFGYIERAFIFFITLFYFKKITLNKSNILFVNSFVIFIVLYLYFYEMRIIQERIGGIFIYSYWILIPIIIHEIEKNFKILLTIGISLLLILKIHLATNYIFYDYDSFLFGTSKSYKERLIIFNKNKSIIEK